MNTAQIKAEIVEQLQLVEDMALLHSLQLILQQHLAPIIDESAKALQQGAEEEQKDQDIESWLKDA